MAEKLTPQQARAVRFRGSRLLVSAAAGSGKTKVLVDRLLSYLTDPVDPANLDDFLMITYTKAAAAELRGKIAAKLSERIAQEPENRHLQRQMQRLYLAKISTVHAFCADLLREYAYRMELPPDFRVGDENECRELRERAMTEILDQAYTDMEPDFCTFADTQGLGRDDRLVPVIVEKVYDSARCHMDSQAWLDRCVDNSVLEEAQDASETVWGDYLLERLRHFLQMQIIAMQRCADLAAQTPEWAKPAALLADTVFQLQDLEACCDSWDAVSQHSSVDFGRLVFSKKGGDIETAERIKAVRSACKEGVERELKVFTDPSARIMEDMQQAAAATRGIVSLVKKFGEAYDGLKRRRRILDFSDLEHRTLDLLLGTARSGPTKISREIGQRFREVLVDEYQDSNAVQDAIFSTLTAQRGNCFMVGDVKQSIYQFRLADPGIFLDKYSRYLREEDPGEAEGRKVILSRNFRSGGAILSAVNDVFRQCMSPAVGGLVYGEDEALHEGVPHQPLGEPEVELHVLSVQEDTYGEEAAFVAGRIRQLLDGTHMVRDGETLRPIRPEDIVILLRSPGSVGQRYVRALEHMGIACTSGGGQDLLQTAEIMTLRSLLQIISNPRQDIPLVAVLASPLFGFTADDLAAIRSRNHKDCIYEALLEDESPRSVSFCRTLEQLRSQAGLDTLARLLERILIHTHMDSVYGAMPEGKQRAENLQTFFHLAVDFETNGRRDLRQFLEHLDAMEDKGLISSGDQSGTGSVTVMSIHKSKGLEFPVVFLCGLSKKFNREDLKAQVLCEKELGLGLSVVDTERRLRYPTIARRAIAARIGAESLSEELRVLYVAMTRPRDRLIMTYADQYLENRLKDLTLRLDETDPELLSSEVSCPGEWILQAALRRTEAGALFALGGKPGQTRVSDSPWLIRLVEAAEPEQAAAEEKKALPEQVPADILERIRSGLAFSYPHAAATRTPSKQTATQRKGREKDEEASENTPQDLSFSRSWRKPSFVEQKQEGTAYGRIIHSVMQHIRLDHCGEEAAVRQEVQRMTEEGILTQEQAKMVSCRRIARFFQSAFGLRLQQAETVLREFKFSILDDAGRYGEGLEGEQVLLQGVVDCAIVEADGISILDFKTDFVTEETLPQLMQRYRPQVEAYAEALKRIYGKPVRCACLYFFHLDRLVTL